jgi:hypothetical protein
MKVDLSAVSGRSVEQGELAVQALAPAGRPSLEIQRAEC